MREFAGADAPGERAQRAVRAGVAVAAEQRHAGQREAELGPDDVHDALAILADVVDLHARALALDAEGFDHLVGPGRIAAFGARRGGDDVVHGADGQARIAHADAAFFQLELAAVARELVHEVPVDVQQLHAVAQVLDHVLLPDLLEHGFHEVSTCFFSKSQTSWKPTSSCNCFISYAGTGEPSVLPFFKRNS